MSNVYAARPNRPTLVECVFKPTGRRYLHCTGCGCNYFGNTDHRPGSQACHDARIERDISRSE
jgi:hypothetical protein